MTLPQPAPKATRMIGPRKNRVYVVMRYSDYKVVCKTRSETLAAMRLDPGTVFGEADDAYEAEKQARERAAAWKNARTNHERSGA